MFPLAVFKAVLCSLFDTYHEFINKLFQAWTEMKMKSC